MHLFSYIILFIGYLVSPCHVNSQVHIVPGIALIARLLPQNRPPDMTEATFIIKYSCQTADIVSIHVVGKRQTYCSCKIACRSHPENHNKSNPWVSFSFPILTAWMKLWDVSREKSIHPWLKCAYDGYILSRYFSRINYPFESNT